MLSLFRRDRADLRSVLLEQDIVYVGGGSTANLLALWRLHGLDSVLQEALHAGVVLAGLSAGMNCWFESSVTDSFGADELHPLEDGLGFLRGSACPHYDGEEQRRPTYLELVGSGRLRGGFAVDDGCALLFRGGELSDVVSSRTGAGAYRVERAGERATERALEARYLGD